MTLTFSSLEDAWGGKTSNIPPETTQRAPGNIISNVSEQTTNAVHTTSFDIQSQFSDQNESNEMINNNEQYENMYCNTIMNHVQGCVYCQNKLRNLLDIKKVSRAPAKVNRIKGNVATTPDVLTRNNENLSYVPFGLEPEVFNIFLFSLILISLIFLMDKRGLKSFKF